LVVGKATGLMARCITQSRVYADVFIRTFVLNKYTLHKLSLGLLINA